MVAWCLVLAQCNLSEKAGGGSIGISYQAAGV